MNNIPLYILLFIYVLFLAFFAVFALINFYHILMTASLTPVSFFVTFFVIGGGILVIYMTWYLLQGTNWQQPMISLTPMTNITDGGFNN